MHEKAIYLIQSYANQYLFKPKANWPKVEIYVRTYERFAVNEILDRLWKKPDESPIWVVQMFISEMDRYSEKGKRPEDRLSFVIARETGYDILYELRELKGENDEKNKSRKVSGTRSSFIR